MKIFVFVGPTLSKETAESILEAVYLPPARQGDILSLVCRESPDVIAIIDSIVYSEMPVWHKEILYALDHGVAVYGSSAIGALRAAELAAFGMIGVGRVYDKIASCEIEDEDEVLVKFEKNANRFRKISESMVNIRATFDAALNHGLIDQNAYANLIVAAKNIYYPERTFEAVYKKSIQAGMDEQIVSALQRFAAEHAVDAQQDDAIELLKVLGKLTPSDLPVKKAPTGSYGELFHMLFDKDRTVCREGVELRRYAIRNYVQLNHPHAEDMNFHALNRKLTLLLAEIFGITASEEDAIHERRRFKCKHNLIDNARFQEWLANNDLNDDEYMQMMRDLARIRKVHQWFIMVQVFRENVGAILEELKLSNEYTEWKDKVFYREHFLLDEDDALKRTLNQEDIGSLLDKQLRHKAFPWSVTLTDAQLETGLSINSVALELAKEKISREKIAALMDKLNLA